MFSIAIFESQTILNVPADGVGKLAGRSYEWESDRQSLFRAEITVLSTFLANAVLIN